MKKVRITVQTPVRWAKWPAAPTRLVGRLLKPGEELILPEADVKWHRFVSVGDPRDVGMVTECLD